MLCQLYVQICCKCMCFLKCITLKDVELTYCNILGDFYVTGDFNKGILIWLYKNTITHHED